MTTKSLKRTGTVHLVGAGPGDPDLLTVKAARLLRVADVVLHDDLVPAEILALAGRHAMQVSVGKRCGGKRITQPEINKLMVESARDGMDVVRLKSGDPGVFGRMAEEIDALDAAGVAWEAVPGVTAAVSAAASVGAALTDRRKSSRLLIVSGHHAAREARQQGARDARLEEAADWSGLINDGTTIAVYMPGHEFARVRTELLAAGLDPETPVVVVSRASRADQRQHRATIATLDAAPELPAPTILLIGESLERVGHSTAADPFEGEVESLIAKAEAVDERSLGL